MGSGKSCDWDSEGRTRDVVQPDRVAKSHGARLASVLAADPDFELRTDRSTGVYGKSNQFANPVPVKDLERVVGKYTTIYVKG